MLVAVMQFSFQDFVQIKITVYVYIALEFYSYRCYQNLPCIVFNVTVLKQCHVCQSLDVYTITSSLRATQPLFIGTNYYIKDTHTIVRGNCA